MPLINPAKSLYFNMDIENLEQPPVKEETNKGLLAPKKRPTPQQNNNMTNEPAFRVGQHMLLFRKQREMLKNA
jgi:hypothetical protein